MRTTKAIITEMVQLISQGRTQSPAWFIERGIKLNTLIGLENEEYAEKYQKAHKIYRQGIEEGLSAANSEVNMKSSDEYKELLIQKGRVEQVQEYVRLTKIMATKGRDELDSTI